MYENHAILGSKREGPHMKYSLIVGEALCDARQRQECKCRDGGVRVKRAPRRSTWGPLAEDKKPKSARQIQSPDFSDTRGIRDGPRKGVLHMT